MNNTWPFPEPNVTGFKEMFEYGNTVTGGLFGNGIPFLIFIIAFVALKRYPTLVSLASSSYITSALTIFLWLIGFVNRTVVLIFIVATAISTILLYKEEFTR